MNAPDPHAHLATPEKFGELLARTREVSVRQSHLEIDPVSRHRVHDEHHAHYGERHDRPAPQAALLLPGT